MKKVERKIMCKDCIYYSGIICHGHGEYWAECNLLNNMRKTLAKMNNAYQYDLERIGAESCWDNVLGDNSTCMFFVIKEYAEVIKK